MRYRKLDENGDYVFGHGVRDFLVNSPETVAQAVETRLRLLLDEWYLDVTDGTDYGLGKVDPVSRDRELRARILETPGVTEIVSFLSTTQDRNLTIESTIHTEFGAVTL